MSLAAWIPGTRAWSDRRHAELCRKTVERVQQIVDGELAPSRADEVLKLHLEACRHCDAEADVFRQLKIAIARCSGEADAASVTKLNDLARRLCSGEHPVE